MMKVIRPSITALNLEFFIADILEEQRNPVSIIFKKKYVYKINQTLKDLIC